jgi:DNA-binding protein HU-beta
MNKERIVNKIVDKANISEKDAQSVLQAFIDAVSDTLSSQKSVNLAGFGSFKRVRRKARIGRNPSTGEAMTIHAKYSPVFKAGSKLSGAVNIK